MTAQADRAKFHELLATDPNTLLEKQAMDSAKSKNQRTQQGYSKPRAFSQQVSKLSLQWLQQNLQTPEPVVLDITAGGGSIPFETGRLGITPKANELNPVAGLILHATCEWPQKHGYQLLEHYEETADRFLKRISELTTTLYPQEPQPTFKEPEQSHGKRQVQTHLFARTVKCPSCDGTIPLSPNWKLNTSGKGIKLNPDTARGICSFQLVDRLTDHSPGTVSRAKATCPYPNCGATTSAGYISEEAQAGRLGQQLYCVIYRDSWYPLTKSGAQAKRRKTIRGFRTPTEEDINEAETTKTLQNLQNIWDQQNILPTEEVPHGDDQRPHNYGMSHWSEMFSPRQLLAHGYCVQALQDLVNQDKENHQLTDVRKAAWCYVAFAIDKLINYNSLFSIWHAKRQVVANTFATHDFGMKWSYAEMPIANQGWGLEWTTGDIAECIRDLIKLAGHQEPKEALNEMFSVQPQDEYTAVPATITVGPAQDLDFPDNSIDAIVFDPPYHNNVNYAELSDFFYVWLKRTAGYVLQDNLLIPYLTDKVNEAIASPARFRDAAKTSPKTADRLATEDYETKMGQILRECRRVIKPHGIMTVMFNHKSTDAWDALTVALIQAGFIITRTWPIKTEADTQNTRHRAAARSTILLVCRPRATNPNPQPWHLVENKIAQTVREDLKTLETYGLSPVDQYLASFGPALQVIAENWGTERAIANPDHPADPFAVTPTDALEVARREVITHRTKQISQRWAETGTDPMTNFYILAQDGTGATIVPFDEANLFARAFGVNLSSNDARRILISKGDKVTFKSARDRFAENIISPQRPAQTALDQVHTAIAIAERQDSSAAAEWLNMQHHNPQGPEFHGTMEALLRVLRPGHDDWQPAINLWRFLYQETPPVQVTLLDTLQETAQ